MADKFVWSGASGANDGSTWEDAYTSVLRDWGAEAGFTPATDNVYVRSTHNETLSANTALRGSTANSATAGVRIYSVAGADTGTTPGALTAGGTVDNGANVADILYYARLYIHGMTLRTDEQDFNGSQASGEHTEIVMEDCTLDLNIANSDMLLGRNTGDATVLRLINCTIESANTANRILLSQSANFSWEGGAWSNNVTSLLQGDGSSIGGTQIANIVGVDLSAQSGNLVDVSGFHEGAIINFRRCLLHASATLVTGTISVPGTYVNFFHCDDGTDADPAYQIETYCFEGKVVTDSARYRTGGATDGERTNPLSWDMDTTVGTARAYPAPSLKSIPIVGWTDGDGSTSHTYRIYFASGATQQDDDIWFELTGPNDAATNSLGEILSNRVAPETAASNHTSDSGSTWNGTDVGTKQYMDITYTPDKPGPISAVVHVTGDAGSTGHIYVDPKIYIDP